MYFTTARVYIVDFSLSVVHLFLCKMSEGSISSPSDIIEDKSPAIQHHRKKGKPYYPLETFPSLEEALESFHTLSPLKNYEWRRHSEAKGKFYGVKMWYPCKFKQCPARVCVHKKCELTSAGIGFRFTVLVNNEHEHSETGGQFIGSKQRVPMSDIVKEKIAHLYGEYIR